MGDKAKAVHAGSSNDHDPGNLLYGTRMKEGAADEQAYPSNYEVGCAACAATPGRTVFTRWGSRQCPNKSSVMYAGFMASSYAGHSGGGANTLCMHPSGQKTPGVNIHDDGNLLYGMEYQKGTVDESKDKDAACVVCELDRWEVVYTQWGRSHTCTNNHQTMYSGIVMSNNHDSSHKGEFVCVDQERAAHPRSSSRTEHVGLLYSTEMEKGSSDEDQYPHNVEVGCSVCAAETERPFAAQRGNAIHGQWVRLETMQVGKEVTVSHGYE